MWFLKCWPEREKGGCELGVRQTVPLRPKLQLWSGFHASAAKLFIGHVIEDGYSHSADEQAGDFSRNK